MPDAKKSFDSVEMMRSLRSAISNKIENMTYEEERNWLDSQPLNDPFLEQLRNKAIRESSNKNG